MKNIYIYLILTLVILFFLMTISSNPTANVVRTNEDIKTNENPLQKISPLLIGFLTVGVVALLMRVVNN